MSTAEARAMDILLRLSALTPSDQERAAFASALAAMKASADSLYGVRAADLAEPATVFRAWPPHAVPRPLHRD